VSVNGRLSSAELAPIAGGRLAKPFALRWNLMNARARAAGAGTVMPNGPYSSYRDFAGQVLMRRLWCARGNCSNAAVPGSSNHGRGCAVDTNARNVAYRFGAAVGVRPPTDAPWEGWHTLVHLDPLPRGASATVSYPVIAKGFVGAAAVTRLQKLLRGAAFTKIVNGHFGIWTRRAVRRFQAAHGMKVDGVVGPSTWTALRNANH
jgi:hypothetical protein